MDDCKSAFLDYGFSPVSFALRYYKYEMFYLVD